MRAKGVSNKKENQKELPVLSHNPGVKYNSLGFRNAVMSMVFVTLKTIDNDK